MSGVAGGIKNNLCFVTVMLLYFTTAVVEVLYLTSLVQCIMKLLLTFLLLSCHKEIFNRFLFRSFAYSNIVFVVFDCVGLLIFLSPHLFKVGRSYLAPLRSC